MMRWMAIILFAFLLLAFESPLLHQVSVGAFAPDLALIVVLYLAFSASYEAGLLSALAVGLIKDAFSMTVPIGLHMEIMVLVFIATQRLSRRIDVQGNVSVVALTAVACLATSLVELALCLVFDQTFNASARTTEVVLSAMLPQALLTAPFGPVVFWALGHLDQLTTRKGESFYP